LSIRQSIRNVDDLWSYSLGQFESNYTN